MVEEPDQRKAEQNAATNAADAVRDIHMADARSALFACQQGAHQCQGIARHEAIRQQQNEGADDGFADTNRGATDENDVSQNPQEEHLQQRQNRHQNLHHDQDGQRISELVRGPAEPGADAHQQQPVAQHHA